MSILACLFLTGAANGGMIAFREVADWPKAALRLGDVAELSIVPEPVRKRALALPLVDRLPKQGPLRLTHAMLAARVRSRMPMLSPWLAQSHSGMLRLERRSSKPSIAALGDGNLGVAAHAPLRVRLKVGMFSIEREALALQAAKPGEAMFVRTSDGPLAVHCCEAP
jgi:hypothetical protein